MIAARIELLQQMPIFGGVRAALLQLLLSPMRRRSVADGDTCLHEGGPAQREMCRRLRLTDPMWFEASVGNHGLDTDSHVHSR